MCEKSTNDISTRVSIPASRLSLATASLNTVKAGPDGIAHFSPSGDAFVTQSIINEDTLTIHFKGHVMLVEVDLTLEAKYAPDAVTITINMTEPLQAGPFEWRLPLGGTAEKVSVVGFQSPGNLPCILKCASTLGPIVIECAKQLPDVAAFLRCLEEAAVKDIGTILFCLLGCI